MSLRDNSNRRFFNASRSASTSHRRLSPPDNSNRVDTMANTKWITSLRENWCQSSMANLARISPKEARRAAAGLRPAANAYTQVPLTGNSLTLLPAYQLTQNICKQFHIIRHGELMDELAPRRATTLDDACFAADGAFRHFLVPCEET